MQTVVKITIDEDGCIEDDPKWHLSVHWADSPRTFCGGEVYGEGEGSASFKEKKVARGGITCPRCLSLIKEIKSIKL